MGKSFWGDLAELSPTRTPTTILKEQGKILEKATKGILRVRVDTLGDASTAQIKSRRERFADITIWFVLVAPLLNYEVLIITVTHDPFLYPLKLTNQINDKQQIKPTKQTP